MKIFLYVLVFVVSLLSAPARLLAQDVTYEQLLHADSTPQDWLMYGGDYKSQRFSRPLQITEQMFIASSRSGSTSRITLFNARLNHPPLWCPELCTLPNPSARLPLWMRASAPKSGAGRLVFPKRFIRLECIVRIAE